MNHKDCQDVVVVWCKVLPRPVLGGTEEEEGQKTSVMIVGVMTDVDRATSRLKLEVLIAWSSLLGTEHMMKFIVLIWKPCLIVGECSFYFAKRIETLM